MIAEFLLLLRNQNMNLRSSKTLQMKEELKSAPRNGHFLHYLEKRWWVWRGFDGWSSSLWKILFYHREYLIELFGSINLNEFSFCSYFTAEYFNTNRLSDLLDSQKADNPPQSISTYHNLLVVDRAFIRTIQTSATQSNRQWMSLHLGRNNSEGFFHFICKTIRLCKWK